MPYSSSLTDKEWEIRKATPAPKQENETPIKADSGEVDITERNSN